MHTVWKISVCSGLALSLSSAGTLYAQSAAELDKKATSAYLRVDGMFLVHKSDTLGATDFGSESNITIGTWAGKTKRFGLGISNRNSRTKFTQINGALSTTWTDMSLSYRVLWFHPYLSVGSCRIVGSLDDAQIADGVCTTVGGGVDVRVPFGPFVVLNLDLNALEVPHYRDHVDTTNDLGNRREAALGVAIYPKLTWLSILIGYRYRAYEMTTAGTGHDETETGPYLGLNFGYDL